MAAGTTRTIVKKHERGAVRTLVTVLGVLGMIGGAVFMMGGAVTGNAQLFGVGGFAFVFWLIMALIARPKTEIITEQIFDEQYQGSSNQNSNNNGGLWRN